MARTPLKREKQDDVENDEEQSSEETPDAEAPPPEVANDPNALRAETVIPSKLPGPVPPAPKSDAPPAAPAIAHTAKRYRVQSCPARVVYAGQVVQMHPGRILDSRSVGIETLEKQGVVLVALPD